MPSWAGAANSHTAKPIQIHGWTWANFKLAAYLSQHLDYILHDYFDTKAHDAACACENLG